MHILSVSEKIFFFICGLGILQGILLAALIYFRSKSDRSVNLFLALYIFCTCLIMTMPIIMEIVGWQNSFFIQPVPLLTGPLLYLYLRSFKETISWRKAIPHFLLFILFFFIAYWNLSALGNEYPDAKDLPGEALNRPLSILLIFAKPVQQVIYYFLARKTLSSYQRSIRHLFSETSRFDLHWARFLINGYIILVVAFILIFPLMLRFPEQFNLLLLLNMALATPYIYLATHRGILQPTIWQVQPGIAKETVEEEMQEAEEIETGRPTNNKHSKTAKIGLNADRIKELVNRITMLMDREKLYQETELTLHELAGKLRVPTYQVSQALNEGMKKNFYDLVNGHRVEEAKRLLLDSKNRNYTILSVGFEAGFNSKTTFNTVFKKFTGLTPTEFRDKQKAETVPA